MTNKEKFIEVFGLNLCYCGNPEHKGLFYITEANDCKDIFLDKFEAKRWLESEYKDSDIVAHCNVERNAYLIAQIMDADAKGEEYIRPISYYDCASALLKMWMDNILTDSEYYRIIDKLNANRKEGLI